MKCIVSRNCHHLLQAAGHQEAALGRQLADEQLEHRGLRHAVRGVGLQHRKLVEVGQQQALLKHYDIMFGWLAAVIDFGQSCAQPSIFLIDRTWRSIKSNGLALKTG